MAKLKAWLDKRYAKNLAIGVLLGVLYFLSMMLIVKLEPIDKIFSHLPVWFSNWLAYFIVPAVISVFHGKTLKEKVQNCLIITVIAYAVMWLIVIILVSHAMYLFDLDEGPH